MLRPAKLRVMTVAVVSTVCVSWTTAEAQDAGVMGRPGPPPPSPRECKADQALAGADAPPAAPRGTDGATLAGVISDSGGQPIRDARITISGVVGEWRAGAAGAFAIRGVPPGTREVMMSSIGFLRACRVVDFAPHDSATVVASLSRIVTKLSAVQIREREHKNHLIDEIDQRQRAGFGYRMDSLELGHLPGLAEAFNFPGSHVAWKAGGWSITMNGTYKLTSKGGSGTSLTCNPTIWIDGMISDILILNDMQKEEIAMIEVYTSAARAPLQYTGTRDLCGIVLVWRKRFIDP